MDLFRQGFYDVVIKFKPGTERADIIGVMPARDYRRMLRDMVQSVRGAAYRITIDNIPSELTFPLAEIDTIHAVVAKAVTE